MDARVLCILCEKFYRKIHVCVYVFDLFLKMEENLFNKIYLTQNLSQRIHLHVIINFQSVNSLLFKFYFIFTLNGHNINWAAAWQNIHNDMSRASAQSYRSSLCAQRVAKLC